MNCGRLSTSAAAGAAEAERWTPPRVGPCGPDRHLVCAEVRHSLGDAAAGDGVRVGRDLLAAAAGLAAGGGCGTGSALRCCAGCGRLGGSTGAGRAWIAPRSRRKGGRGHWPEPDRPGQIGHEAARYHGPARPPARLSADRGQRPRQRAFRRLAGCRPAHRRQARPPPLPPGQTARRQSLRPLPLPPCLSPPRDQAPHRPAWRGHQQQARQAPLGR